MNDYRNPASAVNMINLPTDGVLHTGGVGGGGGGGGGRGSGNGGGVGSSGAGPGSGGLDEDSSSNSSIMMGNPPGEGNYCFKVSFVCLFELFVNRANMRGVR